MAAVLAATTSRATAGSDRPPRPPTVAASFKPAGGFAAVSNGTYAFEQTSDRSGAGILIDQSNLRRYAVPGIPGCGGLTNWITAANGFGDEMLAPGRLIAECSTLDAEPTDLQIYRLPSGPWGSFALPYQCAEDDFGGESMQGCNVDAAGRDWIELDTFAYHSPDMYSYQSLTTGQVQAFSPRSAVSLDSPDLRRRECSRLSYPPGDLVTVLGAYAVDAGAGGQATAPVLERCGGSQRQRLFTGTRLYGASSRVIVWLSGQRALQGIFLPRLRRFTIKLPAKIKVVTRLAVTSKRIYVFCGPSSRGAGHLWATLIPSMRRSRGGSS